MIVIVLIMAYILVIPGMYGLSILLRLEKDGEGNWVLAALWPCMVVFILIIFIFVIVMSPYYLCIGGPEHIKKELK